MDFRIAEAHPRVMNSAEKNPEFGGVCSRTCLGVQQLQVISSSGSYHDAEGALELRKPGGAFNWIKKYCSRRCCDYTLPRNHIIPASVFPGISFLHRISAWHWFWVLLNSCSVPHLSGRPSILEKKPNPKPWIRRGCFIHLVWNIALLIWVCRDHLDRSLWKCLNTYCSFSSPAPVAARIHTHSHHIFCHSVSTVVLPVWVLLQRDREEGRKAAVSSVRWSLVNKCK